MGGGGKRRAAPRVAATEMRLVPIDQIQPYPDNARVHPPEQIAALRDSIREFGFVLPALIDEAGGLLSGHGRLEAARAEGMTEIPCVVATGMTEAQRRAYILADNRLAELATWDRDTCAREYTWLRDHGFKFELTGFDPVEFAPIEFVPFSGAGDGGGSQMSNGTKFRVCLGPVIFDIDDPDHSLYAMAKGADPAEVAERVRAGLTGLLGG